MRFTDRTARLSGRVYLDANANGRRDPGELPFPRPLVVQQTGNGMPTTADPATGYYAHFTDSGRYTLTLPNPPPHYTLTQGAAGHVVTAVLGVADTTLHFGLAPLANRQDLRVSLTAFRPARVGVPAYYRARLENMGTTAVLAGQVRVTLDPAATLVGTSPAAPPPVGRILTWPFTALAPFATRDFDLTLTLPISVPPGTNLLFVADAQATAGVELTPANNTDSLRQTVVGSFDPNDITVNYSTLTPAQIAAQVPLDYVVRFENMGTDTAFSVVITDSLPAGLLQLPTIAMVSQSHSLQWNLSDSGLLTMRFPGIQLPQRAIDSVRSQGFVRFRIVPRPTLTTGTRIENRAHIYFDFNQPVTTNDAVTLVQRPNGLVAAQPAAAAWHLYPNPATGRVTLEAAPGATATLLDVTGRVVRRARFTDSALTLDGLAPGLYVVRVTAPDGVATSRRLVVR